MEFSPGTFFWNLLLFSGTALAQSCPYHPPWLSTSDPTAGSKEYKGQHRTVLILPPTTGTGLQKDPGRIVGGSWRGKRASVNLWGDLWICGGGADHGRLCWRIVGCLWICEKIVGGSVGFQGCLQQPFSLQPLCRLVSGEPGKRRPGMVWTGLAAITVFLLPLIS